MRRASAIALGLLVVWLAGFEYAPGWSAQTTAGWATLFDGSSLDQWATIGVPRARTDRAATFRRNREVPYRWFRSIIMPV